MKKSEFFSKIKEDLEIESIATVDESTNLKELDEYSSLTIMLMIAFIDENFNQKFTAKQLVGINSINELMELIGKDKFVD